MLPCMAASHELTTKLRGAREWRVGILFILYLSTVLQFLSSQRGVKLSFPRGIIKLDKEESFKGWDQRTFLKKTVPKVLRWGPAGQERGKIKWAGTAPGTSSYHMKRPGYMRWETEQVKTTVYRISKAHTLKWSNSTTVLSSRYNCKTVNLWNNQYI